MPVIWIVHANTTQNGRTDWEVFFGNVVRSAEVRKRMAESLAPAKQAVWQDLEVAPGDVTLVKNRYSALAHGASTLERVLRNLGVDTVLVAGTKTDVCCDSTARDAMMLDFKSVLRVGLLRRAVRRRASRLARDLHPAVRRRDDRRRGAGASFENTRG